MNQRSDELRPMSVGDILDVSLRLYRDHFITFLLIALVVYVPYATAMGLLYLPLETWDPNDPDVVAAEFHPGAAIALILGSILFFMIVYPLCYGALIHKISAGYLGEEIGAAEAYRRALPRLLRLIGATILGTIIIFIGLLFCVVPGVIFMVLLAVLPAAVVLEGRGVFNAISRSGQLMRDNFLKGFLILAVIFLIEFVAGIIASTVTVPLMAVPFLGMFVATLLEALVLPIQTAPIILLYYDLRIRKEAFDLERLAETLGQESPAEGQGPGLSPEV